MLAGQSVLLGKFLRGPDSGENDVTVQLNISTIGWILKVTQFHPVVRIVCDGGRPVRLRTNIGDAGSHIDIFIQPEQSDTAL